MKRGFRRVTVARLVLGGFVSIALYAQGQVVAPPTPGVVAGGFCTYRTGFFKTSTQAARRINQYFVAGPAGAGAVLPRANPPNHHRAENRPPAAGGART